MKEYSGLMGSFPFGTIGKYPGESNGYVTNDVMRPDDVIVMTS